MNKKIFYACDCHGVFLKNDIIKLHEQKNLHNLVDIQYEDLGIEDNALLDDIDMSKKLADRLQDDAQAIGVIIYGGAQGVCIALNRFSHIRAVMCRTHEEVLQARQELDANVLAVQQEHTLAQEAIRMISSFIHEPFLPEKYEKYVQKLASAQTIHAYDGVNLIVRAVIKHKDHILLTTVTPANDDFPLNLYFLPGGHVHHNEPAAIGLKREIWEEMNLLVVEMHFLEVLECSWVKKGSIYHEMDIIYEVQIDGLDINQPPQSMDHGFQTFVWVPLRQLDFITILPYALKEVIMRSYNPSPKAKFLSEMTNGLVQ